MGNSGGLGWDGGGRRLLFKLVSLDCDDTGCLGGGGFWCVFDCLVILDCLVSVLSCNAIARFSRFVRVLSKACSCSV